MNDPIVDADVLNALNNQAPAAMDPGAVLVTQDMLNAQLSLERAPVVLLSNQVNTVETQLGGKADKTEVTNLRTDLNTVTSSGTYGSIKRKLSLVADLPILVQSNPLAWSSLRRLLPTPKVTLPIIPLTWEYVARAAQFRGTAPSVTGWIDSVNNDATRDITFRSPSTVSLVSGTTTEPMALRKGEADMVYTPIRYRNKQTLFLVYSWQSTVPPGSPPLLSTRPVGVNLVYPHWLMNTGQFVWYHGTGPTNVSPFFTQTITITPMTNTVAGVPYIAGVSMDFATNPPTVIVATHNQITEHIGTSNALSTQVLMDTQNFDVPAVESRVPAQPVPYAEGMQAVNTNSSFGLTLCGRENQTTTPPANVHYLGVWDNQALNLTQMVALHRALRERYCMPPFNIDNVGVFEPSSK